MSGSGILGYRKAKDPEKHVCTNYLRKGSVSGTRGAEVSLIFFFFLTCTDHSNRNILPTVSEQQDPMHPWRFRAPSVEKATWRTGIL